LNLEAFREEIDRLDHEMINVLKQRLELSKNIAEYKYENELPIRDESREAELILDRTKNVDDEVICEALKNILESVLHSSRLVQEHQIAKIMDDQK